MKNNKIIKVLSLVLVIIFMFTTMGQGAVFAYSGREGTAGHGNFIIPNPHPNPNPNPRPNPNPSPNPPNVPLRAFISGPRTLIPYQSASYSVYVEGGMPPYTYRWSNGCTKPSASYVWHSKGNYTVTVTVTDSNKKTTKAQLNVKVGNDNPVPIPPEPPSSSFQIPDLQQLLKTWSPGKLYDLSNGFKGILVPSFDKKYYMYVFKPNTGKLILYMYDSNSWVLSKVINTIKGFEKPMAVKNYKYSIWNDYSGSNNMGDDWGTKKVTNGSLTISLSGPQSVYVKTKQTYTVTITVGTPPYNITWNKEGFVKSLNSDKIANYEWDNKGTYIVTVLVKDAKGNSAIASLPVIVKEDNLTAIIVGPSVIWLTYTSPPNPPKPPVPPHGDGHNERTEIVKVGNWGSPVDQGVDIRVNPLNGTLDGLAKSFANATGLEYEGINNGVAVFKTKDGKTFILKQMDDGSYFAGTYADPKEWDVDPKNGKIDTKNITKEVDNTDDTVTYYYDDGTFETYDQNGKLIDSGNYNKQDNDNKQEQGQDQNNNKKKKNNENNGNGNNNNNGDNENNGNGNNNNNNGNNGNGNGNGNGNDNGGNENNGDNPPPPPEYGKHIIF